MKKLFLLTVACLALVFNVNARTFVLITGVSNYQDEDLNLAQSTKDAKNFKDVMDTQTKDITLLTSKNVTRANVLEKLRAIANRAQKDDSIIFFYAGHGMNGALYGFDGPIAYTDIVDVLSKSKAKEKICFIDACRSGSVIDAKETKDWTKSVTGNNDIAFIVACRPGENSSEHPFVGAGYFTKALIKALRGKSDKNGDRKITLGELFKYVYADVKKRSDDLQHPQFIGPQSMFDVVVAKW